MNGSITFSRNLNLLIDDDLSTFFQELSGSSYLLPITSEDELKRVIRFGREFLPGSAFTISAGMTTIYERHKVLRSYNFLKKLLPIICFLYTLRDDSDFMVKLKTNLANLPQFDDTFFELECLKYFHRNGFSFQYEPKVFDESKEKNPDFRLTKDDIELFCECKQVRIGQNKAELEFTNNYDYVTGKFPKELKQQLFDAKLRLEVNFKRNPSQAQADLDKLVSQVSHLCKDAQGLRELPLQQIGNSIEYLVSPQSEPSQFPMRALKTGSILLGSSGPRRIWNPDTDSPEGEISFTSTDLARRRTETLARLIIEAKNQLPDDKLGIMIINRAKLTIAKEPIEKRMNGKHYDNIIACVVNPFDDLWTCYRTQYRGLLFDLFEGFQHENPFSPNKP